MTHILRRLFKYHDSLVKICITLFYFFLNLIVPTTFNLRFGNFTPQGFFHHNWVLKFLSLNEKLLSYWYHTLNTPFYTRKKLGAISALFNYITNSQSRIGQHLKL